MVVFSFSITSESFAMENDDKWYVECNYDNNGQLESATCSSTGFEECNCPGSVLGED